MSAGNHSGRDASAPGLARLELRIRARLSRLDSENLLRSLAPPAGIDLASNDYLNLSTHPAIVEQFAAAVRAEGCGSTGSRLLRGERAAFAAIERRFAAFKRTSRSLYFGSGYLANIGVLATLPQDGDVVLSDERNHASLIDGMRLSHAARVVFPHNDTVAVRRLLDDPATVTAGVRFLVVESLFSMDGDVAPLAEYAAMCRTHGVVLIVDEAHAVGIYGERGAGLIEDAGIDANACVSINTAGKALGVAGAFVAGPDWAIEYLVQRARPFVFSTAPPPAVAAALDASLSVVEREPERRRRVLENAAYLRAKLKALGVDTPEGGSQIIPIVLGDNDHAVAVAAALQKDGFDVRAIRPPSVPAGTARLRVSVNAGLARPELDRFATLLAAVMMEVGLWAPS
jgi:8-amino-7-oxononanoate synthase